MAASKQWTLLELVQAVSNDARNDNEIVATVVYLINSGKVLLCGNFAGAKINLSIPAYVAPRPLTHTLNSFKKAARPTPQGGNSLRYLGPASKDNRSAA